MSGPREIALQSHGLTLAAKVWGPENGRRLLAVHGWLDNANSFDNLAPLLPEWRIVAIDLPGHGHSQHRSADAAYHFIDYTVNVAAVVEALGWDTYAYVGHSMGAAIGCILAGTFPQCLRHLVLLDAIGPVSSEAHDMPDRLARHILEETRGLAKQPRPLPSREKAAELWATVVPKLSPANARNLVARSTRDVPGGVTWTYDPRLRGTSSARLTQEQTMVFMRRIACPTLFLRAVDGLAFEAEQMRARCAAVENLQRIEMTGGHHLHMEEAALVADHMRRFFG